MFTIVMKQCISDMIEKLYWILTYQNHFTFSCQFFRVSNETFFECSFSLLKWLNREKKYL